MALSEQQTQAIQYIVQVVNDFAATLPLSARGPFIANAQQYINSLESALGMRPADAAQPPAADKPE
jgi:hypothetical protein